MTSIRQRVAELKRDLASLKAHCLCGAIKVDDGEIFVWLPAGYTEEIDGVRVRIRTSGFGGKAAACRAIEKKLEAVWQDSLWWKK